MLTVAQSLVPALEEPGITDHFLLESPWLPALGIAALAVVLFPVFVKLAGVARGITLTLVLLLLAGGIIALAQVIDTPREQVMDRTRQLVQQAAAGDDLSVGKFLSEKVKLRTPDQPFSLGRKSILKLVQRNKGGRMVRSCTIREIRAGRSNRAKMITQVLVVVTPSAGELFTPTWWQLQWTRNDDDWQVEKITWLTIGPNRPGIGILRGL